MTTGFFRRTRGSVMNSPPATLPAAPMRPLTETQQYRQWVYTPSVEKVDIPTVVGGIHELGNPFTGRVSDQVIQVTAEEMGTNIPVNVLVLGSVAK